MSVANGVLGISVHFIGLRKIIDAYRNDEKEWQKLEVFLHEAKQKNVARPAALFLGSGLSHLWWLKRIFDDVAQSFTHRFAGFNTVLKHFD